ncbi:hypothetical protein CAPTEDRAFT_190346 [Capitella teleta]|uniref:BED-type domain-containing protein n=1 Tax=Capitella teleta TaxID=283909 RepID=R7VBT6_CAPTE|nr:hypothetical protein CAPTEDRAFT_190346 [Capitella teleta]|eukprot:ELU13761.1 hypothetical protein CAPTEDRAFT_190346 [Capitella teleta]
MAGMRTKGSNVWLYYAPPDNGKAKCCECETLVACKGGSTSNLGQHLRKHHGIVLKSFKYHHKSRLFCALPMIPKKTADVNPVTIASGGSRNVITPAKHTQLNEAVFAFIVDRMLPFLYSIFFFIQRDMCQLMAPGYTPFNQNKLSDIILPTNYNKAVTSLKELLQSIPYYHMWPWQVMAGLPERLNTTSP